MTTKKLDTHLEELKARAEAATEDARATATTLAEALRARNVAQAACNGSFVTYPLSIAKNDAEIAYLEAEDAHRCANAELDAALFALALAQGDELALALDPQSLHDRIVGLCEERDRAIEAHRAAMVSLAKLLQGTRAALDKADAKRLSEQLPPVRLPVRNDDPAVIVKALATLLASPGRVVPPVKNVDRIRRLTHDRDRDLEAYEAQQREEEERRAEAERYQLRQEQERVAQAERERRAHEEFAARSQAEAKEREELRAAARARLESGTAAERSS